MVCALEDIDKSLIVCINYVLSGFYSRYYGICTLKRFVCMGLKRLDLKKNFFLPYRMLDLSVTELRSIAKNRGVRGYNSLD